MTVNEALTLYKIPYHITETVTGAGFTSYKLIPCGSSATVQRIKTRLPDLRIATGSNLDLIQEEGSLYLRTTTKQAIYNYKDYNGYIDYTDSNIPFMVGFNQSGLVLDNLDSARHLLIAGTTGSGKSVFLHNLITTFICNENSDVFLVDCKKVELSVYSRYAQVATEVFGEGGAAVLIDNLVENMESRFDDMLSSGVNDFNSYKRIKQDARRQILVIDELNDLIHDKRSRARIIPEVLRIAQKGRAAGFHVVLSTQRPDSTVINGTLKGNIPTRVSFRTISNIDSRITLDQTGAERLAGNGDGLYLRNGSFNLERVQSPYIDLGYISQLMTA